MTSFEWRHGPQGAQGTQGNQGFQGNNGSNGAQGAQGFQGSAGSNGAQGPQGFQGNNGSNGAQGSQGAQGSNGSNGTQGAQGAAGSAGSQGAQGAAGSAGTQGAQGLSEGIPYTYNNASFTNSNPGSGVFKLNNASPASATAIYIGKSDLNSVDVSAYLAAATSGLIYINGTAGPSTGFIFNVTAEIDHTAYVEFTVTINQNLGTLANGAQAQFLYVAKGANGAQGSQGAAGSAGAQGAQGSAGTQGTQGSQGIAMFVNDIANSTFELDANGALPANLVKYADGSATTEYQGNSSGSSPQLTQTATTTTPIMGLVSWSYVKTTSNALGQGAFMPFTVNAVFASQPHQIRFLYNTTLAAGYAAGDINIGVWDITAGALIPLSNANSTSKTMTALPAGKGQFVANFNASANSTYRLVFHCTNASVTGSTVYFDELIVTPNFFVSGVPISDTSTSLTFVPASAAFGTIANSEFDTRRVGDRLIAQGRWTNGTVAASTASIALPSGITIDSTKLSSQSAGQVVGIYSAYRTTSGGIFLNENGGVIFYDGSDTSKLYFGGVTTSGALVKETGSNFSQSSNPVSVTFDIPISTYTSSGNITTGPNLEFMTNTSGITTAGASDTSAYSNDPNGAAIGSIASTTITGNSETTFRVQSQYPRQPTDKITLEFDGGSSGATWTQLGSESGLIPKFPQGAAQYGVSILQVDSTHWDVSFGNSGRYTTNTTYAQAGGTWAGISTWRWRVRKESGVAATALSEAVPGVSNGFLSFNGPKGRADGVAAAAGYATEYIAATISQLTANGVVQNLTGGSLSLTAGRWLISAQLGHTNGATTTYTDPYLDISITPTSNSSLTGGIGGTFQASVAASGVRSYFIQYYVNISTTTTYYLNAVDGASTLGGAFFNSSSAAVPSLLFAIRLP